MNKESLPEHKLLEKINGAVTRDWPHLQDHCEVLSLKEVTNNPNRNWMAEPASTGGYGGPHKDECDELCQRVLDDLARKYNVQWP